MTTAPQISKVQLPTKFSDDSLQKIDQEFVKARDQHVEATGWLAEAAAQVAKAGQAFSDSVKGDYSSREDATSATSKAEKALASAKREQGLLSNVVSYRNSVAAGLASQAQARQAELQSGAVASAVSTWRQERDQVTAWFKEAVIASFLATPASFRDEMAPSVGNEIYEQYDAQLRALAAERDVLNAKGAQLEDLFALSPRGVIATAHTEGKFVFAAA